MLLFSQLKKIFDFPGPAEAEDHIGGNHDLARDDHGGGVLHHQEGNQAGYVQGGGLLGEEVNQPKPFSLFIC